MATARTPRSAWIGAALEALGEGGPDAIRVEALAVRLGVTKGGFYWHFADRGTLIEEMLDTWQRAAVDDVIDQVDEHPGDARAKLHRLYEVAMEHDNLATELAVRDWARRDAGVAERLHQVDNRRMAYLRRLFSEISVDDADAEARSMLAFAFYIGNHFVVAEHGDRSRTEVLRLSWARLLDDEWSPSPGRRSRSR